MISIRQGHEWQKMRSASNPIMMKPQTVKSYIPIIDEIVKEFVDNIPKVMDENGELPGNFHEYLNRWSLESITAITLEKRLGLTNFKDTDGLGMQIQRAIRRIISMGMEFEMKPSVWRFYKTKGFHELMKAYDELTELVKFKMILENCSDHFNLKIVGKNHRRSSKKVRRKSFKLAGGKPRNFVQAAAERQKICGCDGF